MSLFDIDNIQKKLKELEEETSKQEFWENDDNEHRTEVLSEIKKIKGKCTAFQKVKSEINNLLELTELVKLEEDEEVARDIIKNTKSLEKEVEKLELQSLLSGKYDSNNAIITIHPGAGGTESQDWA